MKLQPLLRGALQGFTSLSKPAIVRTLAALATTGRRHLTTAGAADESDLAAVHKNPIVEQLWRERATLAKCQNEGRAQDVLMTKAVSDSSVQVEYHFATDPLLRDQYASPWGTMRYGKLLEDLDALAGNVAFKHADDGDPATRSPRLVTASVDKIRLEPGAAISLKANYQMRGRVIWVGRSSMQIRMEMAPSESPDSALLKADFTFVAKDAVSGKACALNKLQPETEEQKQLFQEREKEAQARKRASGPREDPGALEPENEDLAQELLYQGRLLEDMPGLAAGDAILHRQTKHYHTFMCYPQQRNTAGRVFGGFLMRQAYELAFATAYKFAGAHPRFVEIGEVTFHKPVDIGNLVNMAGSVMMTSTQVRPRMFVEVVASVLQPEDKSSHITNTFTFMFELRPKDGKAPPPVKRVFPSTIGCARRAIIMTTRS